jgi:hypothetical protein
LPAKQDNTRREEIKTELAELREKQGSLKQERQAVYQQLDAINDSIKKKVLLTLTRNGYVILYLSNLTYWLSS